MFNILSCGVLLPLLLWEEMVLAQNFPSYFPNCNMNDPELSKCVYNALNKLKPYVGYGIKEISLPPLNPFTVPKVNIAQTVPHANFNMSLENYTLWGLDNYDLKEFKFDPDTMSFNARIEYEKVIMSCEYDSNGHILLIPLVGQGIAHGVMGPVSATFHVTSPKKHRNWADYYDNIDVDMALNIGDGSYFFSSLLYNNIHLTRLANDVFNINSKLFTNSLTPIFQELAKLGITDFMKKLAISIS